MAAPIPALSRPRAFAIWPPLTLGLLVLPVAAGLAGTLAPAFGYLPAIGLDEPSLDAFVRLFEVPGLARSVVITIAVALASTLISWVLACAFVAATTSRHDTAWYRRCISPLLAAPHVAIAVGLAFLLAPSGFLVRLFSPWLTGWTTPPDWLFPGDPWGLALILGLVVKETAFLVLMLLAAQAGQAVERQLLLARSFGHGPLRAWLLVVLPRLYPSLRLPLFAVLAYGLSPVDMALVLGPSAPPILAVRVLELLGDADLGRWPVGAAAASLLLVIAASAMLAWRFAELPLAHLTRRRVRRGVPGPTPAWLSRAALLAPMAVGALGLAALAVMTLWSVAGRWRFPQPLPATWTLANWTTAPSLITDAAVVTIVLALVVALSAVALAVLCLEAETHRRRPLHPAALAWLYLPLIIPQATFLFGIQVLLVAARLDGSWLAVGIAHLTFVLPYVFLALVGPFRAIDPHWALVARTLGHRPRTVLWRVKLPLIAAPLATAGAVGVAVSATLYLPTLFAGGGQIRTLALEAVALATSDRRSAGVVVTVLALIPLIAFMAAAGVRRRVEARH